ncbi:MAG: PAS domain S-box protein, partial [Desulfonatronovibrionaceae bacterium]
MDKKPTYEGLAARVRELEDRLVKMSPGSGPLDISGAGLDPDLARISLDQAALAVFWIDPGGRFIYVNATACTWLGYSREELLGMDISDVDPNYSPQDREQSWELYRKNKIVSFETVHRKKDGGFLPVRVDANFLRLGDQEFEIAYVRDISERKQAEKKLQETRRSQQILLDNIRTQIWYLLSGSTYGAVNRAHAEFLGFEPGDIAFRDMYEFLPHEEAEVCRAGNKEVFSGARTKDTEEWVTDASGEKRLLSIQKIPALDEQGRVRHVVCTAEDITEKRLAELELQKSEERFALAMQASGEGLWDWDIQTGEVYYSPAYALMLGYTPEEIPYNEDFWKRHIHPQDRERSLGANMECIEGKSDAFRVESRMLTKTGEVRWIQGKGKVVARDSSGRATRMVGTHADITERKQAEEEQKRLQDQLFQAQKMESVGVLAGGVAHDFNNLLQVIRSNLQLLDRSGLRQADTKRLETVERSVDRSAQLVRKLLLFSRKAETKKRPLDLNRGIKDGAGLLKRTIPRMIELR